MIILAGGRATRLGGADKPGLVVGGQTLLAAVAAAGTDAGARRAVVVGPDRPEIADARGGGAIRFVREEPPGSGPVPALRRGLAELAPRRGLAELAPRHRVAEQAPRRGLAEQALRRGLAELDGPGGQGAGGEPWVAVLAADLPFLRAAHLRTLLAVAAAAGRDGAVLADDGERAQWLAGCWRTGALRRAAAGYRGSSLHGLLAPLQPVGVSLAPGPGEPPPWLDCDTEQDLRRARDLAAGVAGPAR
jgi:molybdenum cofactor guanylyltransferase